MTSWAPLALTALTAALLALPVTPALYELWKRGDAAPLPTSRHDGKITNFAEVFRSKLELLRPNLERCRAERELSRTSIEGMEVLLVGRSVEDFDFDPRLTAGVAAVMLSEDARVPPGRLVGADVYADGTLELGEGAVLRAARGGSNITLGKNSAVLRWLHADGSIYLSPGSTAYGRLSAGQSIRLEEGCGFQHMHATHILTVGGDSGVPSFDPSFVPSRNHSCQAETDAAACAGRPGIDDVFLASRPRIRVQGNFVLPAGETLNANVIATGELRLGVGARLMGSAKSYKDTVIAEDACVHGSIVCGGTVRVGARCFLAGPVMAEGDVVISGGSRVGGPDALTTISSCGAQIAAGCQLHGTVWARVRGNVEA